MRVTDEAAPSREKRLTLLDGGAPAFSEHLHVGRPNLGDRARLMQRIGRVGPQSPDPRDGTLGVVELLAVGIARVLGIDRGERLVEGHDETSTARTMASI